MNDRSTRSLFAIGALVTAILLTLNLIVRERPLEDWWLALLLYALAFILFVWPARRAGDSVDEPEPVVEQPTRIREFVVSEKPAAPAELPPKVDSEPAPPVLAKAMPQAVPDKVEPPAPEPEPEPAAAPSEPTPAPSKPDDLKVVEGIGPKMEKALHAAGILTFADLSAASEAQIHAAIEAAGMRFAPSVPTWPKQASYAAKGDFDGLKAYQQTLTAGRSK